MRLRAALTAGFAALVLAAPAQADTFTVTNGSSDVAAGCTGTTCPSLRAAIAAAEITRPADIITVPAGTININNDLVVASDMTIVGASARTNIIDGGAKYRGLRVAAGATVSFSHFTIRNAAAGQGGSNDGGGILNAGTTALDYVHVTTSRATNGGGIANAAAGSVSLQHSLIDENVASGDGGGIYNLGSVETTPITLVSIGDSTIFHNTAGALTGAISNQNNGGFLIVGRSTIADNTGGKGAVGGVFLEVAGRAQLFGTIVARNRNDTMSANCGALKPTNGGFNVEDNDACALGLTADPVLDTKLASAGGETDVLPIGGASPAVNRLPTGDNCVVGTLDQRGLRRPQGAACDSGAYELDVAATYTITGGPTGTISSDSAQIDFSSSDPSATPECQLTGPGQAGGYGPCYKSNAALYTNLANGTFTFSVRDSDFPGSTPATRTFTVAALDSTITGGPTGPTNDTTPTFTFTGANGAVSFQCRFDAATFASCASPFTPTAGLNQGAHTFEVRALSASGAPENTPASRSFTIDTTAPDTTITGGPSGTVASTTATFTFSANEAGSTFQCALDSGAFGACPVSYTGLSQGSHTFQVRATDPAGNPDGSPASRIWTVDTIAPDTTITGGPSGNFASTSATFTFSSTESGSTFQCALDSAAFGACPVSYTGLSQGSHTFQVRATDGVGNVDASPASRTWTADTVAPGVPVFVTPAAGALLATSTVALTGTAEPNARVDIREGAALRGTANASGTGAWTVTLSAVPDGPHTYRATATDAAGNTGAASERTITVDAALPDTTIASGPAEPTNDATPTFTFTATESATFECSIDGVAFAACATPFTTPSLAQGAHELRVRAVDAAGNRDNTPATRTFTVDLTPPPAPEVVSGPDGPTTNTSPEFGFSAADATTTECRLDGPDGPGAFAACVSPRLFNALKPGDYVFFVRSTDAAGNTQTTQRAFTVAAVQAATPTPTPSATPSPTPTPGPVDGVSVGAKPVKGTVLVMQPGTTTFVPLSPSLIKLGAEVDARKGTVEITRSDGGVAKFYDGIFKLSQSGGYTVLTLSEKLTGCPKAKKSSASAAAKKPKSRKLWGDGKGKFRTKGQYSAATVRGTIWLVQDTCTTTLTRVKQGVVEVQDLVKKKKVLVKAPKSYTARAKKK